MKSIFQAAHENDLGALREMLGEARAVDSETSWTALHFAASQNSTEAVELLLEAGALVDAVSMSGETPLHCVSGLEAARVLLRTANVALRDGQGLTAAERAWRNGSMLLFKALTARSEAFLLLASARRRRLLIRGRYRGAIRQFWVIELGWEDGRERCLAWHHDEGWRCLEVAELRKMSFVETDWEIDLAQARKSPVCVRVLEDT